MSTKVTALILLTIALVSCNPVDERSSVQNASASSDVRIVGAMKNVMWKGQLGSSIDLDTISAKKGLYGIGPVSHLRGELLINAGKSYLSKVTSDSTMEVEKRFDVSAPFFVYANVNEWDRFELPRTVKTIQDLEQFIVQKANTYSSPFAFKLTGRIAHGVIHIQNLPPGTKVSSPKEAHQGQINYPLQDEQVEIVGFFSTEHQGIFTHHDSYLHMHLITSDEQKMGHVDELDITTMELYLPRQERR